MGPFYTEAQVLDNQLELIYNSSVWTQDVPWKTRQKWWMTEMDSEWELGKSMQAAWHDDNDNITWLKQFKLWLVPAVVGSIVAVGVLTCALVHSMFDLEAAQINELCSLIWELRLHEFKRCHNPMEASANICRVKSEGTVVKMDQGISFDLSEPQ